ncbi:Translation machinery-associated protein [Dirofilaria immitis]
MLLSIIINFDNITNQLIIVLAESLKNQPTQFRYFYRDQVSSSAPEYNDIFITTIDISRSLLHFVHQNINKSSYMMDSSGDYAFYAIPGQNKQQTVYQIKMEYPNFTLATQKTFHKTAEIFTINQNDRVFPIDRNALLVWKFSAGKRSAWLYRGISAGNLQRKSSFHQIGCILSGINDPSAQLSVKIYRVRRQL